MKKAAIKTSSIHVIACHIYYGNYANLERRNNATNSLTFAFDLSEYKLAL